MAGLYLRTMHAKTLLAGALLAPCMAGAQTHNPQDEDLALAYGDSATVSVATGSVQALRFAPAVASVFTAEDIRSMGATDLREVLNQVPGLNVARSFVFYDPQYLFRGAGNSFSSQVLVLVDGMRRHNSYYGGAEDAWVSMPVDNIARVEVIRGPGSALYGADAFAGVISIITKTAAMRPGTVVSSRLESHGERSVSWLHGWRQGELDGAVYLQVGRSDGGKEIIEADAQTGLDQVFGTHASLAPGSLRLGYKAVDAALRLGYGNWRAAATFKRRSGIGSAAGVAQALTDGGQANTDVASGELAYKNEQVLPNLNLQAALGVEQQHLDSYLVLFPAGAFGGLFPDGLVGAPGREMRETRLSASATYGGWNGHKLRVGLGAEHHELYRPQERKNFEFKFLPDAGQFPLPLGKLVDVVGSNLYVTPHTRRLSYVLLQDEWSLAPDWTLTSGLRHDRYSDFGVTTNPRLALVWDARYNLTLKLLHGRAFRAPSFQELYNNNFIALGNPALRPERMNTTEVALDWQATTVLQLSLNLFSYGIRDIVRNIPNANPLTGTTSTNLGTQAGHGLESELRWQATADLRVNASYSYQQSQDGLTQQDAGYAPRHMLKSSVDWRTAPDWAVHVQARRIAGRDRSAGDARAPVADYTLADLTLHWKRQAARGWSAMAGLRNAFGADAREPSPAPGNISHDFPLEGRSWVLQANYAFN